MICDDEKVIHDEVKALIEEYSALGKNNNCIYKVFHSYSGKELLETNLQDMHILFLDIEMPNSDGIEAGKIICKKMKNIRIIMLTAKKERFKDCFKINAKRFVTKPINKEEFHEALESTIFSFVGNSKVELRFNDQRCLVNQRDIILAESKGGYLSIKGTKRVYDCNMALKELYEVLDERLFVSPTRGRIVNMNYISGIKRDKIYLDDGTIVHISRRKKKDTIQKIVDFDKTMGA